MVSFRLPKPVELINRLWPATCAICGQVGCNLCPACLDKLKGDYQTATVDLFPNIPVWYLKDYRQPIMRQLIYALKFGHRPALAREVINRACGYLPIEEVRVGSQLIGLVPVPQSRVRFATRGYNQALLIAQILKERTSLPVFNCLGEGKSLLPSHLLAQTDRRAKRHRFRLIPTLKPPESCAVILVDDVVTTGTTAAAAIKVLEKAGCQVIAVFALAYTKKFLK